MATNTSTLAQNAYGATSRAVRTEKSVEYQVFAQATNMLTAAETGTSPNKTKLAEAVFYNRKLWSILAVDVAVDGNSLPPGLRAQILSLANFVWKHSSKVLDGTENASALVDINTTIMRGLRDGVKG